MMKRATLMKTLESKWGFEFVRTVEEFHGEERDDKENTGIWTSGEHGWEYNDMEIFNYYSEDYDRYTFGVLNVFHNWLEKQGWYCEWYDAGTMFIFPI